jgi:carbon monoxide dehydrogenase subunit G
MTTVSRTFTVDAAPEVVVPYLADFGHAEQWDPGTERCTRNDTATSTETIEVTPSGAGSSITYTNELAFNGAAKLAAPLGKVVFEKLGHDTEKQLTSVLNGLAR